MESLILVGAVAVVLFKLDMMYFLVNKYEKTTKQHKRGLNN